MDRNVGPTKRAPVFRPEEVVREVVEVKPSKVGVPVEAWCGMVVSVWWLLREAEAQALDLAAVHLGDGSTTAELRLGATKTDTAGRGCRRCLKCTCSTALAKSWCPSCRLRELLARRLAAGALPSDPLFVDCAGAACTAKGVVAGWRALLRTVTFRNDVGETVAREVGGHSMRRTGAQWLARRGLPLWGIQYLGRWGGDAVRVYTAQAFADIYAKLSVDAAAATPIHRAPLDKEHWELVVEYNEPRWSAEGYQGAEEAERTIGGGTQAVVEAAPEGTAPMVPVKPGDKRARYVTNRSTGLAHRLPADWALGQPMAGWKTGCGWGFAGGNALLTVLLPPRPWCSQAGCFKGVPTTGDWSDSSGG